VKPQNIVWIFGSGRTGSSWLSRIMASLPGHSRWNEPAVGLLFGHLYYVPGEDRHEKEHFILADEHRKIWIRAARTLVLDSVTARFPERVAGGYVIAKEPHGSIGAPLIMEALPESRMIFLVRDPRDVAASALDAHKPGSWSSGARGRAKMRAERHPDRFVGNRAKLYLRDIQRSQQAYESHGGYKVLVRYEDLRVDTLETMKYIYSALKMRFDVAKLARSVEMHSWENIPEEKKGEGKIFRKATPGGWKEDLTTQQVQIVEKISRPLLEKFYG
jgi:sulfotransferase family protein